ncbi:MAG TPA: phage/plasmid primase, P4 family [Saprospiraceae bacterium]|jgi:putative DNA primase/helicase|nr:hypothetical protein [Saprospiraceae bacterium]HQW70405.1 phage/plasmid primase, P4 family [Saprospiraceae bacterium]
MSKHDQALISSGEEQGKFNENSTELIKIEPVFIDLNNPEPFINEIEELFVPGNTIPHNKILEQLISQIEPLDFEALAFPVVHDLRKQKAELEEKLINSDGMPNATDNFEKDRSLLNTINKQLEKIKLGPPHYIILSIENILEIAGDNKWGLCKNQSFIYLFNGAYWSNLDKDILQKFIGEAAEAMGVNKYDARYFQFKDLLYKQFLATAHLPAPECNNDLVMINMLNGTFEISNKQTQLRHFNQADFITYQLPFKYDSESKAPLYEHYLNHVLPDKASQDVLAEFIGYLFVKHGSNSLKEEKALILYGSGANGKSVFFEIINAMLGSENVSSYSLQSLTAREGYYRAKLANVLVNYASEINGNLETSIFKQLVSGEPVEARLPYGQPFMLTQYAKLIFNCNELPKDVEHTAAYFRRFLIIPFDVTIPEAEQDKNLHTKIIGNELSGVFNWALEGLRRLLLQKKFTYCDAAHKALEQYKLESNSVKLFLKEHEYEPDPKNSRLVKDLYDEYKYFCIESGLLYFKRINFTKQLRASGIQQGREGGTGKNIAYLTRVPQNF